MSPLDGLDACLGILVEAHSVRVRDDHRVRSETEADFGRSASGALWKIYGMLISQPAVCRVDGL
jgi:hypothetical protein